MSKLYSSGKIGQLELKNRITMAPMGLIYNPDGTVSDRLLEFFRLRARGGVGLIFLGAMFIDPNRICTLDAIYFHDDEYVPGLRRLTDAVHGGGAKIVAQLMHNGRYAHSRDFGGVQSVAPSALYCALTRETPHEMSLQEVEEMVGYFAAGARRSVLAGFDGVEICTNSGYLIGQFLSAVTNKRSDKYGGDLTGRMTFLLEVVAAVRQAVGPDYPVIVRLGGNDFVEGGNTTADVKLIAKALEKAGVDAISLTGGWHEATIPQVTTNVPHGAYSYFAKEVKESVSIPVIMSNRMNIPAAEKTVDEGKADFINFGRPLIADPEMPLKATQGRYNEIRPCIGCNQGCLDHVMTGLSVECLCNAEVGREAELAEGSLMPPQIKTSRPEKILVVGAGVAGLEYARVAASRGHKVTIWEKKDQAGGQIEVVSAPPGRHDFVYLVDYLVTACQLGGVEICYGKEATAEEIQKKVQTGIFDRVIVATGAEPIAPPIKTEEGASVVQAWDVLRGKAEVGVNVVVVGGGAVGVETALLLAEIGTLDSETLRHLMLYKAEKPEYLYYLLTHGTKRITVVEMLKGFSKDMGPTTRWIMVTLLKKFGVNTLDQTKVVEIKKDGVLVETAEGQTLIPADSVVLAVGSRSSNQLYQALEGKVTNLDLIGDAIKPRKVMDAIREAYDAAIKF